MSVKEWLQRESGRVVGVKVTQTMVRALDVILRRKCIVVFP